MLTTTTFEIPGHRVVKSIGVVRGITVRTRSLPMTIVGGLRTLFGGRAGIFAALCESARDEAFHLMQKHAAQLGANAVIGVRRHWTDGGCCRGALLWNCSGCSAGHVARVTSHRNKHMNTQRSPKEIVIDFYNAIACRAAR